MSNEPIKVAIIGLGRAGLNIHIKRIRDDERYKVTAVTDWVPERIQEVTSDLGCEGYSDYKELLEKAEADVVVVASASSSHPDVTCEVLTSGRHAICEKPMASSTADADRMIATANETGRLLFMHHNRRFSAEFLHLKDIVESQRLGEVFEIRMRELRFSRRFDWQTLSQFSGGVLNNAGSHYLDLGMQLLGAPVQKVYCDLKQVASAGDVEDHVKVVLTAENGRVYDLEISLACAFPEPKWTICGEHGTMTSNGSESRLKWFDPATLAPITADPGAAASRRYDNDDVIEWHEETVPATAPLIGDFYDNVWGVLREGKEMVVKAEEAREVVRVIEASKQYSGFYSKPRRVI